MDIKTNKKIFFFYNLGSFFLSHRLEYVKYLIDKKYDIYLLSNINNEEKFFLEKLGINCISFSKYRNVNLLVLVKNILFIRKIIKKYNPEICEFASHSMNILGILATLFLKKKLIYWITGMGSFFIKKSFKNNLIRLILINIYRLNFFNNNSFVIIENKFDLEYFVKKKCVKRNNIFLVRGAGVNEEKFKNDQIDLNNNKNIILMPCRIIRDKGVLDFLSVADYFYKNKISNYRFVLLGDIDQNNPSSLSKLEIKKITSHPLLEWHNHSNDIIKYLQNTKLLLFLSYREGFPKTLVESLMMNVPVLCYDVQGCNEVIIDEYNGKIVKLNNIKNLCLTTLNLLNDKNKLKLFSKNARQSVIKDCSNNEVFSKTYKIYKNLSELND